MTVSLGSDVLPDNGLDFSNGICHNNDENNWCDCCDS